MNIVLDMQYALNAAADDPAIPTPADFERWVQAALVGERDEAEVSLRIVGADEGAALNATYRHRAGPTYDLSFPSDSPAELAPPLLGDVVICAPEVAREAREKGKAALAHWEHKTETGRLHLKG